MWTTIVQLAIVQITFSWKFLAEVEEDSVIRFVRRSIKKVKVKCGNEHKVELFNLFDIQYRINFSVYIQMVNNCQL